jgi:uncharacterized OB-fold protein
MSGSPADTSDAAVSRPVPDEDSAPYWAALRDHRILLQRCMSCGETRAPRMPGCPQCGSESCEDVQVRGTGTIYSWVVIHRPLGGLTTDQLPRTIVTVELDEGCRVLGRLVHEADAAAAVGIDVPVEAVFVDQDGWTELAFALVGQR